MDVPAKKPQEYPSLLAFTSTRVKRKSGRNRSQWFGRHEGLVKMSSAEQAVVLGPPRTVGDAARALQAVVRTEALLQWRHFYAKHELLAIQNQAKSDKKSNAPYGLRSVKLAEQSSLTRQQAAQQKLEERSEE